ncbi:hypothetical protein ACFWF7_28960 [Nocardia sp. NPDC060256]|uniref:hypothetical protein n=1 Tax=unclassified Nocardia TaxID=2637762 RepID=UPI00366960C4
MPIWVTDGMPGAVIVDAVRCEPATPGRIWRTDIASLRGRTAAANTHALGIPDTVPLGCALDW